MLPREIGRHGEEEVITRHIGGGEWGGPGPVVSWSCGSASLSPPPPQVIVHGNGFPFHCSIVLFAVTAERFACAITQPCIYLWARSGVDCQPSAAAAQPRRSAFEL